MTTALLAASVENSGITQLWVAQGTYYPSLETNQGDVRSKTFMLVNGVAIYGGFPTGGGDGTFFARNPAVYTTILSGDLVEGGAAGPCPNPNGGDCFEETSEPGCQVAECCEAVCMQDSFCCSNEWDAGCVGIARTVCDSAAPLRARHVVRAISTDDPNTILNGFTITKGWDDGGDAQLAYGGGGMHMRGSPGVTQTNPVIVNCVFIDNRAPRGGAVQINGQPGGGANPQFIDCKFLGNHAGTGGGISNHSGSPNIVNCLFSGNVCTDRGGAFFNFGIEEGTISHVDLINCTISRNAALPSGLGTAFGGGVFNANDMALRNCIIWGNEDSSGVTEVAQVYELLGIETPTVVEHSCIQNLSIYLGNNNIGDDPLFIDDDGADNIVGTLDDNLRLLAGSKSVNTGFDAAIPADTFDVNDNGDMAEPTPDLDRQQRIIVVSDRGAFELPCLGDCVTSATFQPPPDGNVDGADLAVLLGSWSPGPCDFNCCSDIVESSTLAPPPDGIVDGADLAVLLGWWGSPCIDPSQSGGEGLMSGGEGMMAGESSGGGSAYNNPYVGTDLGDLLDLAMQNDSDAAAFALALLLEMLGE